MSDTFALILKLSDERQQLYFSAGKQLLTPDQHRRLDELNGKLPTLWDAYRRELASTHRAAPVVPFERVKGFEPEAERKAA